MGMDAACEHYALFIDLKHNVAEEALSYRAARLHLVRCKLYVQALLMFVQL